ncbi:hypothetical protein M9H77_02406 [Catharanthus roseus]|uniref:Uncharacterized protein n=1 Tax=Catharanthus roseus TaxID=4058 RepID=A0ACC0C8Q1_CATRO|nr:hypothetical protein M9H77_02406 [Catharanthus roseus]
MFWHLVVNTSQTPYERSITKQPHSHITGQNRLQTPGVPTRSALEPTSVSSPFLLSTKRLKPTAEHDADHSTRSAFRGLHCIWLAPRTLASSDDVDGLKLLGWIHLRGGVVPWRVWPEWHYVRHRTMHYDGTTALWRVKRDKKLRLVSGSTWYASPGSVEFYVNGECGGYGIECS